MGDKELLIDLDFNFDEQKFAELEQELEEMKIDLEEQRERMKTYNLGYAYAMEKDLQRLME